MRRKEEEEEKNTIEIAQCAFYPYIYKSDNRHYID